MTKRLLKLILLYENSTKKSEGLAAMASQMFGHTFEYFQILQNSKQLNWEGT